MSDDMKKVLTMLAALTTQVGELKEELAALKKQPKPTPVKEEKPDTSFAGLYGSHLTNPDGSGKKLKHCADTKDGGDDDWYGVWDAKNKVIKRINEDGSETDEVYESFGDFGTAHYKSLGENNKKKLTHDSNGGWDKVKVLDSVKRKFFSASTLLAQGEKPRSQSRAKSASRKSNAAAAAGGGGGEELNIAKPKNSRRKPQASPQPSPKEVAQAAAVLVVAATQDEDDKKFFYYKDDDGCLSKITSSVEFYNTFCDSFSYERKELIKTNSSDIFERLCEFDSSKRKGCCFDDISERIDEMLEDEE
jgi:hypothetical protein